MIVLRQRPVSTATDTTRDRILEAAGNVFAAKGFESATVREICQRAGANLAAINYYFGDKQRLYFEVVRRAHESRSQGIPLPVWTEATPPERRLADFVRTLLARMLAGSESSWQTAVMLREVIEPTEACHELVRQYIGPQFVLLQSILAELLPAETTAEARRLTGFSIVGQCLFYRVAGRVAALLTPPDDGPPSLDRLAEHIARFSLAALGRDPAAAGRGGEP